MVWGIHGNTYDPSMSVVTVVRFVKVAVPDAGSIWIVNRAFLMALPPEALKNPEIIAVEPIAIDA